jgi:hypothetical protein
MTDRRVAEAIDMEGRGLRKPALHDHAVTAAGSVVTHRTNRIETLAATGEQGRRQLDRQLRYIETIR